MIEKTFFQTMPCGCVVVIRWNSELGIYSHEIKPCMMHDRSNPRPAEDEVRGD